MGIVWVCICYLNHIILIILSLIFIIVKLGFFIELNKLNLTLSKYTSIFCTFIVGSCQWSESFIIDFVKFNVDV